MLCRLAELAGGEGREISLVPRALRSLLLLRLDETAAATATAPSSFRPPPLVPPVLDGHTSTRPAPPATSPHDPTPPPGPPLPPPARNIAPFASGRGDGDEAGVSTRGEGGDDGGGSPAVGAATRGVVAFINRCPHVGVPLNLFPDRFLTYGHELIICSAHGATFQKHDGFCVGGPCAGKRLTPVAIELARCNPQPDNAATAATTAAGSAANTDGAAAVSATTTTTTAAAGNADGGGGGHDSEWCVVLPERAERSLPPELLRELTTSRPAIPPRRTPRKRKRLGQQRQDHISMTA